MSNKRRPLYLKDVLWDFLVNVLDVSDEDKDFMKILKKIHTEEQDFFTDEDTLLEDNRDYKWRAKDVRQQLRLQIVKEMLTLERLDDDDLVVLGQGGGLPQGGNIGTGKIAFFLMGLPASGKSTVAARICELYSAFLLDSDLVKRKLPEFHRRKGASLVHEESSIITNGGQLDGENFKSILESCMEHSYNLCIPKIGANVKSVLKYLEVLKKYGYYNCIVLVSLEREKSVRRAYDRFVKTGRYVPLSMIFDDYANDPMLCYYRLRGYLEEARHDYFDEMMAISSDVSRGVPYSIKDRRFATEVLRKYLDNL